MQGALETFSAPAPRRAKAALVLLSLSLSLFSSLSSPFSFLLSLLLSSLLLIDRNVQRAGPKARKGSARAALSLFFLQYSPFSSLHIISALRSPSLLLTGPESALSARKGSLSPPHFPLLLSLSFSDRARQQTARLRRANWLVYIKWRLINP